MLAAGEYVRKRLMENRRMDWMERALANPPI
jgi:hypothetical protein